MQPSRTPRRSGLGLAVVVLLTAVAGLASLIYLSNRPPRIESLAPDVVAPGDDVVISGDHFGDGGRLEIAGKTIPSSFYQSWTDTEIRVTVPSDVSSGLLRVVADGRISAGRFLAHGRHLPAVAESGLAPGLPYIDSVEPSQPRIGDILVIRGRNFGGERGNAAVYLTWQSDAGVGRIEVPDTVGEYLGWNERVVRVAVPDGAVPGPVAVRTAEGFSNEVPVDIVATSGTKSYHDKASYAIHYGVSMSVGGRRAASAVAGRPSDAVQLATAEGAEVELPPPLRNVVYLWFPGVHPLPEQRNRQVLAARPDPLSRVSPGSWLYRLTDLRRGSGTIVEKSVIFERYAVRTEIVATRVQWDYDLSSPHFIHYTRSTDAVPASSDVVRAVATRTVGRERNPYSRARYVYNYVSGSLAFDPEGPSTVLECLETGTGNSMGLSLVFVSMARAVGVPARLVGGYRVTMAGELVPHHWTEFYLASFGWVPVDATMGGGAFAEENSGQEDRKEYYFGNVDNRRMTLLVDEVVHPQLRQDSDVAPIGEGDFWRFVVRELSGELPDYSIQPLEPALLGVF